MEAAIIIMKQALDEQGLRNAMEKFSEDTTLLLGFMVNSEKENTRDQVNHQIPVCYWNSAAF